MILKKNIISYFEKVKNKEISITELANTLGYSRTWISLLYNRYIKRLPLEKEKGHRKSIINEDIKAKMIDLYRQMSYEEKDIIRLPPATYFKQVCIEQIQNFPKKIHPQSIRNILKRENLFISKKKKIRYRKRFQASFVGQIIQGDVSEHRWIPQLNRNLYLILFMDDRSRYVLYAKLVESDNLENHLIALKTLFKNYGYPVSIYYDNDSKYNYIKHNSNYFENILKENENAVIPRALKELGVNLINSTPYQPQGKGKVERKFLTFQNQLPFYLKLKNPESLEEANYYLQQYVDQHNSTFSTAINDAPENIFKTEKDIFRDLYKKDVHQMEDAFTKRSIRAVNKVNEISYNNKIYMVPSFNGCPLINRKVEVRENPGSWIKIYYNNNFLIKYALQKEIEYA